jgi:hydroxyethylthiazole kinase-like uncharacterized protein yjeF
MGRADSMTIEAGTPGYDLMLAAGKAVADEAAAMGGRRILVVAGPGNNGGDGFVAARMLRDAGRDVRVALLGSPDRLKGDAAQACTDWEGDVENIDPDAAPCLDVDADIVVDSLFGAGLSRGLTGPVGELVDAINRGPGRILAVDLPSGIDGATGTAPGSAIEADATVTFFRLKPGHLLYPGRRHCGRIVLAQIGIDEAVLPQLDVRCFLNSPMLWSPAYPRIAEDAHKYARGHTLVVSGPWDRTGAARLAALAALRIGSGLVTVAADDEAARVHAAHLTAVMIRRCAGATEMSEILADARFTCVAIGPAAGLEPATCDKVMACLRSEAAVVLDADALSVFADQPDELFRAVGDRAAPVVMTPHGGEFARLFGDIKGGGKVAMARAAAERAGAVIVLKGADTVVAAPGGRAAISANAPPWLATAGSGDVLSGIVAGLLAQGMESFDAACAAAWMHGEAAAAFGPGLTADDLPAQLPTIIRKVEVYR